MSLFDSQNVFSGYKTSNVLQGVSLQINSGEMVAVIGRNGVGKTTFIKTIIGLIEIRSGEIFFDEKRLKNLESFERAKLGIGYVPQGRDIFPQLSVKDNLRMGGFLNKKPSLDYDLVFNYFPFPSRNSPFEKKRSPKSWSVYKFILNKSVYLQKRISIHLLW